MVKNKKAISVVVGYVLLIVVTLALSVIAFTWLKSYVPVKTKDCPEGISLVVKDYSCDTAQNTITLTMKNNGRFNIEGFLIRAVEKSGSLATCKLGNPPGSLQALSLPVGSVPVEGTAVFSYANCKESQASESKIFSIEIIPERAGVLCENSILRQEVSGCDSTPPPAPSP